MGDKRTTIDAVVDQLRDGMTVGIGGWGSRRKPMALVRAIARSSLRDLTVVSYGGPDVGVLCATGKIRKLVYGFVSLDSIPLEPHFRKARQSGALEIAELDEGMLQWGLYAAALRLPFLPTRSGLGSDVMAINPDLRTVRSPYGDGEELLAMPALQLDVALLHVHRADAAGNAVIEGPDPFFDDLYAQAARRTFVCAERIVATEALMRDLGPFAQTLDRTMTHGVVHTPNGAHFTSCEPYYGRDESFQRAYAATGKDPAAWEAFKARYIDVDESTYQAEVAR